jgi:carboxyl-terminal processing protease
VPTHQCLLAAKLTRLAAVGVLALNALSAQTVLRSADSQRALHDARRALVGTNKDLPEAKKLLLEAVKDGGRGLGPGELCYAYCYLGYVEDLRKNREAAIGWFEKALKVEADQGILGVAKFGLSQPVTWIRHLDEGQPQAAQARAPVRLRTIRKGYVTDSPPDSLRLAATLGPDEQRENFEILWEAADTLYAHFDLKKIDWGEVHQRYRKLLTGVKDTQDFYILLFRLVNELRDTHSWLQGFTPRIDFFGPNVAVHLFGGKPYLTSGEEAGAEILDVDGLSIADRWERLRPYLRGYSSERAYRAGAAGYLLSGDRGSTASVRLRLGDGRIRTAGWQRDTSLRPRPLERASHIPLTRQRFVHFGRHASGVGYIWIASFNGREEIADEFDRALASVKDAPGIVIDVRDNQGGFGNAPMRIVGRFASKTFLASIGHIKGGFGHSELLSHPANLSPTGQWQYKGPVALLTNVQTGSATDLFTVWLKNAAPVVQVGSTTHGNLSGTGQYVVLPCGLAARISNGYVADPEDRPIEVNGNVPDVPVEPAVADYLAKRDPVLERAIELILRGRQKN